MRWGLVPVWAKDLKVGYRMINAKNENLTKSKAYGPLVGKFRHRCLIVADGFYEWMKAEDPKQPRQPWRFTVDGGEPFAFAGLCTRKQWEDPEDRGVDPDGYLYSATIITTTPNAVVKPVHDRMPAILPSAEAEAAWLDPTSAPRTRSRCAARSTPARMDGAPANPALNKVGKGMAEGPELLVAPQILSLPVAFGAGGRGYSPSPPASSASSSAASRFFFAFFLFDFFGFFVDRRRQVLQRRLVSTVALPASVLSVQATFAAGASSSARSCRRAVRGRVSACRREEVFDVLGAFFVFGPFDLDALFVGEAFRQVFCRFRAPRSSWPWEPNSTSTGSGLPGRRCPLRRSAGRASAGRPRSGRFRRRRGVRSSRGCGCRRSARRRRFSARRRTRKRRVAATLVPVAGSCRRPAASSASAAGDRDRLGVGDLGALLDPFEVRGFAAPLPVLVEQRRDDRGEQADRDDDDRPRGGARVQLGDADPRSSQFIAATVLKSARRGSRHGLGDRGYLVPCPAEQQLQASSTRPQHGLCPRPLRLLHGGRRGPGAAARPRHGRDSTQLARVIEPLALRTTP